MPDPIQKITLSRYAMQALSAHPELAVELDAARAARAPFGADEIVQALRDSGGICHWPRPQRGARRSCF